MRGLDLGLLDRLGDLRGVVREHYGEKVKLQVIGPKRGLFGMRGAGGASSALSLGAGLSAGLLEAAEERALWARYGL